MLAPVVFQMFTRAPKGRDMIDAFRPYMNESTIGGFQQDMATIGAAADEVPALRAELRSALGVDDAQLDQRYPLLVSFEDQWPGVDADMNDMLTTMRADIVDYEAVDALPSFDLFPWFFVVPGVLVAGAAGLGLLRMRGGRSTLPELVALIVLGAGVALAPVAFQMFDRAPKGGDMIDDFQPLMVEAKVRRIQGYFVVLGGGEARCDPRSCPRWPPPAASRTRRSSPGIPALAEWGETWPATSSQMAPMIGAMADNLGNYAAVKALPPFPLFPWFFVLPGLLVVVFAGFAWRDRLAENPADRPVPKPPSGVAP